jgi:hypothetical protein
VDESPLADARGYDAITARLEFLRGLAFFDPSADAGRMKKPTREEARRMCTGKRRYRTQADALDAAMLVGVERRRKAYLCPLCGNWHLTSSS